MECGHADGVPLSDGTLVCLQCFVADFASQDMVSLKCHALAQLGDAWAQDAEFKQAALSSQHCQLILGRLLEDLCSCCDDTLAEELCRVLSVLILDDSRQSRAPQSSHVLEYFLEGTAFMAVEHKGPGVARLLAFVGSIAPRIFGQGAVPQGQALVGAVLSILSAEKSVQSQDRGSEHLVPCLNVLLGALEVPELEPCVSSRAADIILACFEVAASKKEADLLLALQFLGHLAKRGSLPLDSLCHSDEWAGRLPGEGSLRHSSNTGTSQYPFFEVLRAALMCASEDVRDVQLYALDLFSAVSSSASSPAPFLERALQCGLSDYLIEATRSAARGKQAQSAEVLLGSLQCLLALADAPEFGLRLAVGLDTLVSVLASSVDSGLTPAFILCTTVLERAFAQHEPASMTEAQKEKLLRLLFWGVERHHGYVAAQGDRATFRACFIASASTLQELLKWHATILPLTPESAQCIHQSLLVACQALSSCEAQIPDSELLTSALKLVSAVQDVALSTRYAVAQRRTEGEAGDLYSCLPAVVEQSIAPLLASLGFSNEHAALTSSCSRTIAQFLRCHDQQQELAKKLTASGFVPWVLKGLEAARPGESAHAPIVEMVVIASARSIQLPEAEVASLLDPSQISQLPQGYLGTLDLLGSCGSQAVRQSAGAPSQGAVRASALIVHAASNHKDHEWDSILGEEYRGFFAAAVNSYVRGTCWDGEPVWSILLAASLLALASGGSPHQEPAALPWRGTLAPEQTPQQTLCAALERVSGAVHFPLQSWPLALPVWILHQDRLQGLFKRLVQGWICDCYCAQASEGGQGSDSADSEESPVQPLVRLLEHPDLQIPSRVAEAIKGHIEGTLGPGACANAVEILLGLAKLAAHSCSISLALQQLGVVACLQKAALLHVSSMEARKFLAFLSLIEALLTPWSRAAPVDEAAAFLGEMTPLVSTMVQQVSLTLRGTEGSSPEPGLLLGMLNTVNLALAVGLAQAASMGLQYARGIPVRSSLTMLADTILRSFLSSKLGEAVSGELLPRLMANDDVSHEAAASPSDACAACPSADSPALALAAASFLLFWLLQQAQQAHRGMPAETTGPPSLEAVIHWATKVLSSPSHMDTLDEDQCSPLPCVAAQVLLAALLRISPVPCTKPMGTGWQIEPQLPPSTVTCLLFGLHSAACSGSLRIRNAALLAICVVISWGSDESYVLACSPWTQYLFETKRFWGEPPANEGGETPGTTPPGWGQNQGKGTVRRCLASLVASMSRHGMGLLVPHVVTQLKRRLESHSRAPSGMRLGGGAVDFGSSESQAVSEDQENATRITISKHHGAVAVVECSLLEWLAFTAMHADGDTLGLRAED